MKKLKIAVQKKKVKDLLKFRDLEVFVPVEKDRKMVKCYHVNQILTVKVFGTIDKRSLIQLALYWVLCGKVSLNTNYPKPEDVSEQVKLTARYIDTFYDSFGKMHFRTKSISYESMQQPEFNEFMNASIPIMADMLDVTEEELLKSQHDTE